MYFSQKLFCFVSKKNRKKLLVALPDSQKSLNRFLAFQWETNFKTSDAAIFLE